MPLSPVEPTGEPAAIPVPDAAASGNGGSGGCAGGGTRETVNSQRSIPTPFLTKTYQVVDDPIVDDLILWKEYGSAFIVWRPAEFARDLLPNYFTQQFLQLRSLAEYIRNWCQTDGNSPTIASREERKLCSGTSNAVAIAAASSPMVAAKVAAIPTVVRTISPPNFGEEQVISSTSSPAANAILRTTSCTMTPKFLEENKRLRKENTQLNHELTQLRGFCNNIVSLMKNCASSGQANDGVSEDNRSPSEGKPLDLMPATTVAPELADLSPRLFVVSINVKRIRRDVEEAAAAEEEEVEVEGGEEEDRQGRNPMRRHDKEGESDLKAEPLDGNTTGSSDDDHRKNSTWLELGKRNEK